jgi:hypothetical protein
MKVVEAISRNDNKNRFNSEYSYRLKIMLGRHQAAAPDVQR